MKKALFTGPSGISCGRGNRLGIISNTTSLIKALEAIDYEVEQRIVVPGENLSQYDKVFVTQQTIASFTAPFAYGMTYALGERDDAIIVYDDYQAPDAFKLNDTEGMLKCLWKPELSRQNREEAYKVERTISKGIEILCTQNERTYLLPLIDGGQPGLVKCNGIRKPYDPTPFMNQYIYDDGEGNKYIKRRRWVLAALQDNQSWLKRQKFVWPVLHYGVKKHGQPRLTEQHLAQIYSSSYGVISPPHKKLTGSGWFRVRYVMAKEAGSLLYCDPDELSWIPGYRMDVEDVQLYEESEVKEIIDFQKKNLNEWLWEKEQLINFVGDL